MSAHNIVRSAFAASAVCACLAAVPSRADEFSWQIAGGATRFESDATNMHSDAAHLSGTYYLNPVDDSDGPLALASFLHPTTRLSADASDVDTGSNPKAYSVGGRYVLPGRRWYTGAEYSWSDLNLPASALFVESDPKGYELVGGRYFGATTTLELGVGQSKATSRTSLCPPGLLPACGSMSVDSTRTDWSLDALHVGKLRSLTYSVGGSVHQSDIDTDVTFDLAPPPALVAGFQGGRLRTYSVSGELFPTTRLGVGLSYSRPDTEGFDIDTYALSARWFFTRRVALEASLGRSTASSGSFSQRSNSTALSFTGRF